MKPIISFYGFGNMGQALFNSMQHSRWVDHYHWQFYDPNPELQKKFGQHPHIKLQNENELFSNSFLIFICIKPQNVDQLYQAIQQYKPQNCHLISMMAGIKTESIQQQLDPSCRISRIMPNTPARIQEGATAICLDAFTNAHEKESIEKLLKTAGTIVHVAEPQLNTITALSGSGPAFTYQIIKDFLEFAKNEEIDRDVALPIICQTLIGAAKMVMQYQNIDHLIESVSSPSGTTVKGLESYHANKIGVYLNEMLTAASDRAKELAKESEQ